MAATLAQVAWPAEKKLDRPKTKLSRRRAVSLSHLPSHLDCNKLSQVRGALVAKLSEFAAAAGPEALTAALAPLRVGSLAECEALLHSLRAPGFAL